MPFRPPIPERTPPTPEGFSSVIKGLSNTDILNHFKQMEASKDYMYRDSEGFPTIGFGHLLNKVEDALKLNFIVRSNPEDQFGRKASPSEVERGYNSLPAQTRNGGGYRADYYNPFGKNKNLMPLFISDDEIDFHLMKDIYNHSDEVKKKFSGFDNYPTSAQKALLDMEFNMGPNLNAKNWPSLYRAVEQRDWLRAAQESQREQVDKARNTIIKGLFHQASEDE